MRSMAPFLSSKVIRQLPDTETLHSLRRAPDSRWTRHPGAASRTKPSMVSARASAARMPRTRSAEVLFQQPGRVGLAEPAQTPVAKRTDNHGAHAYGKTGRNASISRVAPSRNQVMRCLEDDPVRSAQVPCCAGAHLVGMDGFRFRMFAPGGGRLRWSRLSARSSRRPRGWTLRERRPRRQGRRGAPRGERLGGQGRGSAQSRRALEGEVPVRRWLECKELDGSITHRPGCDVTLSAPKSDSLMAMADGDERAVGAHDQAARATPRWIEANAAEPRMRDPATGATVWGGDQKMVVGTFRHGTGPQRSSASGMPDPSPKAAMSPVARIAAPLLAAASLPNGSFPPPNLRPARERLNNRRRRCIATAWE